MLIHFYTSPTDQMIQAKPYGTKHTETDLHVAISAVVANLRGGTQPFNAAEIRDNSGARVALVGRDSFGMLVTKVREDVA